MEGIRAVVFYVAHSTFLHGKAIAGWMISMVIITPVRAILLPTLYCVKKLIELSEWLSGPGKVVSSAIGVLLLCVGLAGLVWGGFGTVLRLLRLTGWLWRPFTPILAVTLGIAVVCYVPLVIVFVVGFVLLAAALTIGTIVSAPALVLVVVVTVLSLCVAFLRGIAVAWHATRTLRIDQTVPDVPPADASTVLFQLSDLHVATPGGIPYEIEMSPNCWPLDVRPTSEIVCHRIGALLSAMAGTCAAPVVVTGDITDTGDTTEWDAALAVLATNGSRVLLVPGNHDIAINRASAPDISHRKRIIREQRFRDAKVRLGQDDKFPVGVELEGGVHLFLLNSNNYPSRYVLTNAVGLHGKEQLAELESMLSTMHGPIIVATHHHPIRHRVERTSIDEVYMIAIDGNRLISMLVKYRKIAPCNVVLLIHGHRHVSMYGTYKGVMIYGHPSSTLGQSAGGQLDGMARYAAISISRDKQWYVSTHKVDTRHNENPTIRADLAEIWKDVVEQIRRTSTLARNDTGLLVGNDPVSFASRMVVRSAMEVVDGGTPGIATTTGVGSGRRRRTRRRRVRRWRRPVSRRRWAPRPRRRKRWILRRTHRRFVVRASSR